MTEIKPCGHCGEARASAAYWWTNGKGEFCVECPDCHTNGPRKSTEAEAIAAWNTRTPDPSVITGLREAREALANIEYRSTNHGGWFDQPGQQFAEYSKLGDMARTTLAHLDTLLANQEGKS